MVKLLDHTNSKGCSMFLIAHFLSSRTSCSKYNSKQNRVKSTTDNLIRGLIRISYARISDLSYVADFGVMERWSIAGLY